MLSRVQTVVVLASHGKYLSSTHTRSNRTIPNPVIYIHSAVSRQTPTAAIRDCMNDKTLMRVIAIHVVCMMFMCIFRFYKKTKENRGKSEGWRTFFLLLVYVLC